MNRLFIIGNGFDLAHGLPTSYKHFVDDYIESLLMKLSTDKIFNDDFISVDISRNNHPNSKKDFDTIKNIIDLRKYHSSYFKLTTLTFNNKFFEILINRSATENWVDIESLYYNILKSISDSSYVKYEYPYEIKDLNDEFEQVKNLLETYLQEKIVERFQLDFTKDSSIGWEEFYEYLKPISLFSNEITNILKEFTIEEDVQEIKEHFEKERKEELVNNIYFLNFNYTPICNVYSELFSQDCRIQSQMNYIHGELKNVTHNKINFGFGDEMDDDYKKIENLEGTDYLKNFKSFQYLQNSNYNDLLRFINSEKFQVVILGHSCGVSDRTLLNTIFEHINCRSIKVFYHRKDDGSDNYTEMIQNISRHFKDKKMMREKIVNKTLCKPMPQIQLPLKK